MPSENGWEPAKASPDQCEWITVPGTNPPVSLQLLKGWPLDIMRAVAADFNAFIQPLRDGDSAARTETNSVPTSNHLNATAMDLDWDDHPFHVRGTFNADQMGVIRELLAFYEDTIFWAGDWNDPIDEMHWQMGYNTFNNPHTGDFIARKIRADGFSTFRRDNVPVPPPPPPVLSRADGYALKIIAEGQRRGITPRGIQIALATALVESNITIYANEAVPESMNIPHDAVGSDAYSVGIFQQQVRDTGSGWWWGDAATCMDPTSSAGLFYDRLAKLDYNGPNSPGSYAQTVQSSAFPDRYDQRFNDAVAIYNRLATGAPPAPPTQGEGFLMALSDAEQHEVLDLLRWLAAPGTGEFRKKFASRSAVREPNEGPVDSITGMNLNTDGNVDFMAELERAKLNYPPAIERLKRVAAGTEPGRTAYDALLAQAMLAAPKAIAAAVVNDNAPQPMAPVAPQVVYVDRPVAAPTPPPAPALPAVVDQPAPVTDKSMGDVVKTIVDAVEQLKLADALTIQDRATLAASIKILEMKNGSQL